MESWWSSPDYEYRFQYTLEQTHVKAFFNSCEKRWPSLWSTTIYRAISFQNPPLFLSSYNKKAGEIILFGKLHLPNPA